MFEISVKGPNLAHFEAVVKEAMDLHWGGKSSLYFRAARLDMLINVSVMNDTRLSYVSFFLRTRSQQKLNKVVFPFMCLFNFVENYAFWQKISPSKARLTER